MMPEYIPTSKEKDEVGKDHLFYEIQVLTAATIIHHTNVARDIFPVNNLCLEAVPMHTRTLINFFGTMRGRGGRDKDALAKDFLKDGAVWSPPVIDKTHYPNLAKVIERADKEIAHLTYERVPKKEKKTAWDLIGILTEIYDITNNLFLPKCKEEYITADMKKLMVDIPLAIDRLEEVKPKI
jgi:hypothetical protein